MSDTLNLNAPPSNTPAPAQPAGDTSVLNINANPNEGKMPTPREQRDSAAAQAKAYLDTIQATPQRRDNSDLPPIVPSDPNLLVKDANAPDATTTTTTDAPATNAPNTTTTVPASDGEFDFATLTAEYADPTPQDGGGDELQGLLDIYATVQDAGQKKAILATIKRLQTSQAVQPKVESPAVTAPVVEAPVASPEEAYQAEGQRFFENTYTSTFREMAESRNLQDITTGTTNVRDAMNAALLGKPILADPNSVTDPAKRQRIIQANNHVLNTVRDLHERANLKTDSLYTRWDMNRIMQQQREARETQQPQAQSDPRAKFESAMLDGVSRVAAKAPDGLRQRIEKVLSPDNPRHKQAATLIFDKVKELNNTLPKSREYDLAYITQRATAEVLQSFPSLIPGAAAPKLSTTSINDPTKVVDNPALALAQQTASAHTGTPTSLPPSAGVANGKPTAPRYDVNNARAREGLARDAAKAYLARKNA